MTEQEVRAFIEGKVGDSFPHQVILKEKSFSYQEISDKAVLSKEEYIFGVKISTAESANTTELEKSFIGDLGLPENVFLSLIGVREAHIQTSWIRVIELKVNIEY